MTDGPAERYLRLGLQLGRHVDGIVDSYYGPADLAAEVDAAPPVEPRLLVAAAEALLDDVPDSWLRDQVAGLRVYAGVLAGEALPYADEVEGCFGVRPVHTEESVFAAAHERLEGLLPGAGTLADRLEGWRAGLRVPADQVGRTVAAVIERARASTRAIVELPDGEGVEVEVVQDESWLAFCEYRGDLRSRISVNVDLPLSGFDLLQLTLHEAYPGHHAESMSKDHLLARDRGLLEQTIAMVPTPQALVSEAIATVAPLLLLEGDDGEVLADVVRETGVDLDLDHALDVERALAPCEWVSVNAALLLHDDGANEDEVRAYLRRWGLVTDQVAAHAVRFLTEPTSRTYIINYPAGRALGLAYLADHPERFRRLLTEQVRVGELLAAH